MEIDLRHLVGSWVILCYHDGMLGELVSVGLSGIGLWWMGTWSIGLRWARSISSFSYIS